MPHSRIVNAIIAKEQIFSKLSEFSNSVETTPQDQELISLNQTIFENAHLMGTYNLTSEEFDNICKLSSDAYDSALKSFLISYKEMSDKKISTNDNKKNNNETSKNQDVVKALGRLVLWMTIIVSIVSLCSVKYNEGKPDDYNEGKFDDVEDVLALTMHVYKKYKQMQKILDAVFADTKDPKVREQLDWISLRATTICQNIGYINLFHTKNPNAAFSYLSEEIELYESNVTANKIKNYALIQVYNLYAYNLIILGDVNLGRYYLSKLKNMLHGEEDSHDDLRIDSKINLIFDKYYITLDAFIKTIPDELNDITLPRLKEVQSILRPEDEDYEPYLKKVSTLLTALIKETIKQKSTDYYEAVTLAQFLSNLENVKKNKTYIDFGKKNIAFIAKKLAPKYELILKNEVSKDAPYEISFNTEKLSLKIISKNDLKSKPGNKIKLNDLTYTTKKDSGTTYIEIPYDAYCANLPAFISSVAAAKLFHVNDVMPGVMHGANSDKSTNSEKNTKETSAITPKPLVTSSPASKPLVTSNYDIPLNKQEVDEEAQASEKKVKVKTRGIANKNEQTNIGDNESQKTVEPELTDAERLNFDKRFNNVKIYPIRATSIFPEGRYFGFYSKENTHPKEVAEETHTQALNTLISGKVSAKSPAIKIVKNQGKGSDTLFKLAPLCDFRMIGRSVQDITDSNGRVTRSLIAFDTPANHSTQKKFY